MLLAHQEFRVKKYCPPEIKKSERALIERSSITIALPAISCFIARNNFVVGMSEQAGIRISCLGYSFKKYFVPKVEIGKVAAEKLTVCKLLESTENSRIFAALGGEKQEISLGQFFLSFAKQQNGNGSLLLTNRSITSGYVRDIMGDLWELYGLWFRGWCFGACPLDDTTIKRNPGDWILSR